jgi:hypothetical protein
MKTPKRPYAVPRKLEPSLARVLAYWEELKRGEAEMPFWDDLKISALPDLSGRLMLVEVADKPVRFRLGIIGEDIRTRYGGDLAGKFLDEIEVRSPLEYLNSQCSATVEDRVPTYYGHDVVKASSARAADAYSRLLLPMWGNGHIGMLLGAVVWS